MDPSSELRNPEKVFYPPAIREKALAPTPPSTAAPTHVEDQPPASSDKAPTTSATAKETPSSNKVPFSVEVAISRPQPFAEEQTTKDAEKEKVPKVQRAK